MISHPFRKSAERMGHGDPQAREISYSIEFNVFRKQDWIRRNPQSGDFALPLTAHFTGTNESVIWHGPIGGCRRSVLITP